MTTQEQHEVIEQAINTVADQVRETLAEIGGNFYEGKRRLQHINATLSALSNKQTVSRFKQEVRTDNPFSEVGAQQEGDAVKWDIEEEQEAKPAKKAKK